MTNHKEETLKSLSTPCYVVDEELIEKNVTCLHQLEIETGCSVLFAQKAFSFFRLYPLIGSFLTGSTASGLFEAKLAYEEMPKGKENHVFAPAYKDEDIKKLVKICDHIVFNSYSQYQKHKKVASGKVSIGLRINPEYSTQTSHAVYDPCASGSRLGITYDNFIKDFGETLPKDIEGLHFHTLCEQDSEDLVKTFFAFEKKFAKYLRQVKWLNLGGGHHITRQGYNLSALKELLKYIKDTYKIRVYLEPGEAIALNAGYLVTEVQDIVKNDKNILILDASAECHMPDVLEMPYRPPLLHGYNAEEKAFTYRLSSLTCLSGDVIGDYSFDTPVRVGDKLIFEDMAIYSFVKNNTFNGIPLPDLVLLKKDGTTKVVKKFNYLDFKRRLS